MTGLEIPLPTDSPYNDPGQYTPLLLSAIGVFLLSPDIWTPEEYPDARGYMNDLMVYIVELMEQGLVQRVPIGTVSLWLTDSPPERWRICDGAAISRTDFAELFAVLGTFHGPGNGTTTFNLPYMIGVSPMGAGTFAAGTISLGVGGTIGEYKHTLTVPELPAHNHPPLAPSTTFVGNKPSSANTAPTGSGIGTAATTGNTGSGTPHNVVHPVIGVNYMICTGVVE